jgi:hypothetical protein
MNDKVGEWLSLVQGEVDAAEEIGQLTLKLRDAGTPKLAVIHAVRQVLITLCLEHPSDGPAAPKIKLMRNLGETFLAIVEEIESADPDAALAVNDGVDPYPFQTRAWHRLKALTHRNQRDGGNKFDMIFAMRDELQDLYFNLADNVPGLSTEKAIRTVVNSLTALLQDIQDRADAIERNRSAGLPDATRQ